MPTGALQAVKYGWRTSAQAARKPGPPHTVATQHALLPGNACSKAESLLAASYSMLPSAQEPDRLDVPKCSSSSNANHGRGLKAFACLRLSGLVVSQMTTTLVEPQTRHLASVTVQQQSHHAQHGVPGHGCDPAAARQMQWRPRTSCVTSPTSTQVLRMRSNKNRTDFGHGPCQCQAVVRCLTPGAAPTWRQP